MKHIKLILAIPIKFQIAIVCQVIVSLVIIASVLWIQVNAFISSPFSKIFAIDVFACFVMVIALWLLIFIDLDKRITRRFSDIH